MSLDLFNEKAFEKLDPLTQVIEPYVYPKLEKVVKDLPSRFEFTFKDATTGGYFWGSSIDMNTVMNRFRAQLNLPKDLPHFYHKYVVKSYEFAVEGDGLVDRTTLHSDSRFMIVKVRDQLSQEEVKEAIFAFLKNGNLSFSYNAEPERSLEVVKTLSINPGKFSRKHGYQGQQLMDAITSQVGSGAWNLRSGNLAETLYGCIERYVDEGGLDDMNWLCRFKLATHTKYPLYEIGELNDKV